MAGRPMGNKTRQVEMDELLRAVITQGLCRVERMRLFACGGRNP